VEPNTGVTLIYSSRFGKQYSSNFARTGANLFCVMLLEKLTTFLKCAVVKVHMATHISDNTSEGAGQQAVADHISPSSVHTVSENVEELHIGTVSKNEADDDCTGKNRS